MTKKAKGTTPGVQSYVVSERPTGGQGQQAGPNLGPHGSNLPSYRAAARTDVTPPAEEENDEP
jgi:hypothetical protein